MTTSPHNIIRVPVLIIGAGPSGLTASLLLQQYGVDAITVSRFGWTAHNPRAHHLNPRAMEVMRGLGLEQALARDAMPHELVANINWCVSLAGEEIARLATYHQGGEGGYRDFTPSEALNIHQHHFEPVMAKALLERGGKLLFNTECESIEQDDDKVRVHLRNRITGAESIVEADYLIGADGANSMTAKTIGLEFDGTAGWGAAVNVWIEADLARFCAHRPGSLYWTNLPGNDFWIGSGVFVSVRPWSEWMVSLMYDPREGDIDLSNDALMKRIGRIIGDDTVPITIRSCVKWTMNALYATRYSKGRIFCMGDAVHRHSPAGGLGANTCILDAYNLCWKLKLAVKGKADPALLETYSTERQPIGRAIIERSMKSVGEFTQVAQALGYSPGQSVSEGEAQLALLSAAGAEGEAKRDALAKALRQQSYQFNAVGFELGYRYPKGALWDAQEPPFPSADPDLVYAPTTVPGAALPHVWLTDDRGQRISTLDIVSGGEFHLLTGPGGEGWANACEEIALEFGLHIVVDGIGPGQRYRDPYSSWRIIREISDSGCLLVRPDAHIAWRAERIGTTEIAQLREGLATMLGRDAGRKAVSACERESI